MLYLGSGNAPSVTAYEVASGRPLRSVSLSASLLEVSPDGSALAVASGQEVVLLDAGTLAERRRLQGPTDRVEVISFSPSGALLAVGLR